MNTDTSDHEPKAKPAATPARVASHRRHPVPVQATDTAPGSTTTPLRARSASPSGDIATTGYTFRTWNRLHTRNRRTHFAIAIAFSVAAHVGLVLSGEGSKTVVVANTQAAKAVENSEEADTPPAEFAPPMQADLPSLVTVDSFVQPLQPPVPSGISTDMDMMAVPKAVSIGSGAGAPKLFEITELDRVPNRIRTGLLNYPQEFRRSRKEGDVHLLVVIDPTGHVRVAKVLESTHPEFTRAAVSAAEQSVYESPRKGGAAVSAQYTLRVPFRLTTDG
jgi:periplasmic protein TonB